MEEEKRPNRDYSFVKNNHHNRKFVKAVNLGKDNEETFFNSLYAVNQHLGINPGIVKMVCEVHGNWGPWRPSVDFNRCSCYGTVRQRRSCNDPAPANGGNGCPGGSTEIRDYDCNECHCSNGDCQHYCSNYYGGYECNCRNGYRKDGHGCIEITCRTSDWPAPANGVKTSSSCRDGNKVSVGTSCSAKCNAGYVLVGSTTSRCGSNGNWINSPPNCRAITCSSISVPVHATVNPPECTANPREGTTCTLACTSGYSLVHYSGSQYQTTCSAGRWTKATYFYCRDLLPPIFTKCPEDILVYADKMQTKAIVTWQPVKAKDNDGHLPQMTVFPSHIQTSVTSYEFQEGNHLLVYTARDTSGNEKKCSFKITVKVLRCSAINRPVNGKTIPQTCSKLQGSKCSFECNEGYNLTGSTARECLRQSGSNTVSWTGVDVTCKKITCPTLIELKYTTKTGVGCFDSNPGYQTYCTFKCQTGYQAKSGSKIRTCKSNGKWSGEDLVCEIVTCPALPSLSEGLSVSNYSCISNKSTFQDECRYACGSGYLRFGTDIKTCTSTGQWAPPGNPYCRDISMPTFKSCPSTIKKLAHRSSWSTRVNWTIPTASDNAPEEPTVSRHGKQSGDLFKEGHHTIRYIATDKTGNTAQCLFQVIVQVITCTSLQTPLRGSMQCTNKNVYGSECRFGCNHGYTLRGSQKRTCEKDNILSGQWTGNATSCEAITCPNLDQPVNGFKSGCSRNTFGEKCLFYCNIGSKIVNGSSSRTCLQDGTWSGTPLVCKGITCPALTAPPHGQIIPSECYNSPGYRVTCKFVCRSGYLLVGSNIRTCTANEQWNDNSNISCKDIEKPTFTTSCPYNIAVFAEANKDSAQVVIPSLNATDNSGELPVVTVDGRRTNYTAGRHAITITASDSSGNKAQCRFFIEVKILRCFSHPSYIINGRVVGECKNTLGSTCHFQCNDGYNLTGSSSRSCKVIPGQIQGYWSGTMPFCSINSCPPLKTPTNGYVYPPMCIANQGPVVDTTCLFGCYNGFVHSAGTSVITCRKNSTWNRDVSTIISCLDKIPPVFPKSCPSNIRISLSHDGTAIVNWTIPVAEDNSHIPPTITVHPSDAIPPYAVNQSKDIEYIATDQAGNIGKCSFKVVVEDNTGPQVAFCPQSQKIVATSMTQDVSWKTPEFVDNSNMKITPRCNRQPGKFYWGVWTIHCQGYDNNPNNMPAVCSFNITVKPKPCPPLSPPKNGAKACDTWVFGRFCTPHCNEKYDFAVKLALGFMAVCGTQGFWTPAQLPDCSEIYIANSARKAASVDYYFSGDCNNATVQEQIKIKFISIFKSSLFQQICTDNQMKDRCVVANVQIECGVTRRRRRAAEYMAMASRRYRRSLANKDIKINFEISVSLESGDSPKTKSEIEERSENASKKIDFIQYELTQLIRNGSMALNISGNLINPINNSLSVDPTIFTCNKGQIFLNRKCVACAVGTYHNSTLDKCISCNKGWYQDTDGKNSCIACPNGMSTVETKSKNKTDCKAYCKQGYSSPTGLEPCLSCEKGSYQSLTGQLKCISCLNGKTTQTTGAASSNNCSVPCKPGSYSPTGLEPCTKCDKRSYQQHSESTTCLRCSGTMTTLKEGSNSSSACQEINECDSNPCQHGSKCFDLIEDFICQCQPGYTGKRCEQDIDDCASLPCQNNATCHDHLNNFTCTCAAGFKGSLCQLEIDECGTAPCRNNATCHDMIGRYKCYCQPGYEGDKCENETNECQPNPCLNGGSCLDKVNAFSCLCPKGFSGSTCEENIDDCPQNRCDNGAACVDLVNNYTCACLPGYMGNYCQQEIDECHSNPCQHNGTCYNKIGSFTCACSVGYNGSTCENEIDECSSNPCLNGATCRDAIGAFSCVCGSGYQGDNCQIDSDECASQPCTNNATCSNTVGSFACRCKNGFTGKTCDTDIDECFSSPCQNNGSCINERNGFTCQCLDGFTGNRCQVDIDECDESPCKNNATCFDGINDYQCSCSSGFTGNNCKIKINYCAANPCENNGKCRDLSTDYRCDCSNGYNGRNCSININECFSKPCLNNGTCQDLINGYSCSCFPGFSGVHCRENIDDCKQHGCLNNATCLDGVDAYRCICPDGFTGTFCEFKVSPCDSFPCYNGGTCTKKNQKYFCSCPPGFTGQDCRINIDDCKPENPCKNNGICTDLISNYTCTCPAGFHGQHCENITDHCIFSNCSQNGNCVNLPNGFRCNCSEGYFGPTCTHRVNPCITSSCKNGATCRNTGKRYNCSCRAGFTGKTCDININDCQRNRCLNNATCIDQVNGYVCLCLDGFNGTHCEDQMHSCKDVPCLNNGTCVENFGGYECKCSERFGGLRCENDKSPCKVNLCLNGGTCSEPNITSFSCICPAGFKGLTCDINIDDCASSPCPLHSDCIDKVHGYSCQCHQSHTGRHCETAINDNFNLFFKDKTHTSSVELRDGKNVPDMSSFAIALWVKPDIRFKTGTIFTYMVPEDQSEFVEISFSSSIVKVVVKSDSIQNEAKIIDGKWHFIGVSWSRKEKLFTLYADGRAVRSLSLPSGPPLKGGGRIILGQRYSWSKKQYISLDSFVGLLHQVNVWKKAANQEYMWNAAHKCSWPIGGNVYSWIGFMSGIKGNVMRKFPSSCKALLCMENCTHYVTCNKVGDQMVCTCQKGFTGQLCDININDCLSNPCVNGKCVDEIASYRCECDKGFYGDRCEKKLESNSKECPTLPKLQNGDVFHKTYAGKHLVTLECKDNFSFKPEDVTTYVCGPETDWKWNRKQKIIFPRCLSKSDPIGVRHKYKISIPFSSSNCQTKQKYDRLKSGFKQAFLKSITYTEEHSCFVYGFCKIENINAPRCSQTTKREKRSFIENLEVQFELTFSEWGNTSQHSTVTEISEAVAFQLSYCVSIGNFTIVIDGSPIKPRGSSLKLISKSHQCKSGSVNSYDNSSCVACPVGTHLHSNLQECTQCPVGQYQDAEGEMTCQKCPDGYSTKIQGATSKKRCYEESAPVWMYVVPVAVIVLLIIVGVAVVIVRKKLKIKVIDRQYSTLFRPRQLMSRVRRMSSDNKRYNTNDDITTDLVSQYSTLSRPGEQHSSQVGLRSDNWGYDTNDDTTAPEPVYATIEEQPRSPIMYEEMGTPPPTYENKTTQSSAPYENAQPTFGTFGETKV